MAKVNLVIIFLISLVFGWQLLRPGFYSMHDDLQVMRLYEMDRCFKDGQLPCRWAPDMAQNYGQPLFNFYSAFPYYLGQLIHLLGFSFIDTVKLLFLLSLFLSGIFTYLLARHFLNDKAALVAALAYLAVPYHALDIFVRGALAESWGLTLVPLVLYCLFRLAKKPNAASGILLSLSLAALLTTHNLTVLISAPFFVVLGLYALFTAPKRRQFLLYLAPALLLGIGLAAFFILPVLFEKSLIQTSFLITDYFDFRAHFVTISQLFTKLSWGYGPSRFNSWQYPETLSFFVGLLPIIALIMTPIALWLNRKKPATGFFLIAYVLCFFALFMTHAHSVLIWEKLPFLSYLQFPWRFLSIAALMSSLLIGFLTESLLARFRRPNFIVWFFVVFLVLVDISYFRFEKYFPELTDTAKLTGAAYDVQIKGALLDYLPKTSPKIPQTKAPSLPVTKSGQVTLNYFDHRSNYFASEFDVLSDDGAVVQFPIMYFPGWEVYQNRAATPIQPDIDNDYGLITVDLTKGHTLIQGFFENTPIRTLGNLSTFFSGLVLLLWFLFSKNSPDEN